jgi:hypothetical protein
MYAFAYCLINRLANEFGENDEGGNQMPYKEGQPTLMGFLGNIPVSQVVERPLFGKTFIRLPSFCQVLSFLYETGAILGRAKRDRLMILGKMLALPGKEGQFTKYLGELAKKRLDTFRSEVGKEPDTFFEFILFRELEKAIGVGMTDAFKADIGANKKIMKAFDEKCPVERVQSLVWVYGNEGIGFGSSFPQFTERMYRNAYEGIDTNLWSEARAHGLAIPEKPEIVSLEEREATVFQLVAAYASEYYPELLDPLDLRVPDL